ncbi:MAG: tetratricopeptide repeat protein [Anaerolineales bacterium]
MAVKERLEEGAPELDKIEARASENPNEFEPQLELGWALYGRDRTQEALDQLKQVVQRFPEEAEAHYALGLAHKRAGNHSEATQAFQKAIESADKSLEGVRSDMMLRLAKRQIHLIEHGTWDLKE